MKYCKRMFIPALAVIALAFGVQAEEQSRATEEYMLANDPAEITRAVKQAQEFLARDDWASNDLLNIATDLVRRASGWKERGIPEYQDLSDVAGKLIDKIRDNGNPDTAFKVVWLKTRNYSLNGKYEEGLSALLQTLRHYFPDAQLKSKKKLPEGAVLMIMLAAEQYSSMAAQSNKEVDKLKYLSFAAQYYLKALENTPQNSPRFQDLSDRLHICRESLKLLGFRLELPSNVRTRRDITSSIVDSMIAENRFHDVVAALESRNEPALRIRFVVALANTRQYGKIHDLLPQLVVNPEDAPLLLTAARSCLATNQPETALELLNKFLSVAPDAADAETARLECATILVKQKSYAQAAQYYQSIPKDQTRLAAAKCFYQAGDYQKSIEILEKLPYSVEQTMLLAQAQFHHADYSGAAASLKGLLRQNDLDDDIRRSASLLLISAQEKDRKDADAAGSMRAFVEKYPDDPNRDTCLQRLIDYNVTKGKKDDLFELGKFLGETSLTKTQTPDYLAIILANVDRAEQRKYLMQKLISAPMLSPAALITALKYAETNQQKLAVWQKHRVEFRNTETVCALYFSIAQILAAEGKRPEAVKICALLLQQKPTYDLPRVKFFYAGLLTADNLDAEARTNYQELLLLPGIGEQRKPIILKLAQSWVKSGEYRRAIATAWTGVPLDKVDSDPQTRALLNLIIDSAKAINSQSDMDDAASMLPK